MKVFLAIILSFLSCLSIADTYPPEQKLEFLADTGVDGNKYVLMANW